MITQSTYRDGNTELGKEMTPGINQSFEESENSQVIEKLFSCLSNYLVFFKIIRFVFIFILFCC